MLILTAMTVRSCTQTKEIKILLTNSQNLAVAYDGHYQVSTEGQVAMTGTTPHDYDFSLSAHFHPR